MDGILQVRSLLCTALFYRNKLQCNSRLYTIHTLPLHCRSLPVTALADYTYLHSLLDTWTPPAGMRTYAHAEVLPPGLAAHPNAALALRSYCNADDGLREAIEHMVENGWDRERDVTPGLTGIESGRQDGREDEFYFSPESVELGMEDEGEGVARTPASVMHHRALTATQQRTQTQRKMSNPPYFNVRPGLGGFLIHHSMVCAG